MTRAHRGRASLETIRTDGSAPRRLLHAQGKIWRPTWSPDGRRIALYVSEGAHMRLWVVGSDGTGARCLTPGEVAPLGRTLPRWSPRGRQIAFTGLCNGREDVYVAEVETGALYRLSSGGISGSLPVWLP